MSRDPRGPPESTVLTWRNTTGRYAILQAHGQDKSGKGSDIGGVDAAYACHPSLVAVPADFEPVESELSFPIYYLPFHHCLGAGDLFRLLREVF